MTNRRLPNTIWEGCFFDTHSLSLCNRQTVSALLRRHPEWNLSLFYTGEGPAADSPLGRYAYRTPHPLECTVRFQFPADLRRPPVGNLVIMQPWEYGAVPKQWVEAVNSYVAQMWAPSTFVRDCLIEGGANPEKVLVVPHGIDPTVMRPDGPQLKLETDKTFKFLFVGGTIARKGADVLLKAYLSEFGPDEDVALVVKDFGTETFYAGQTLAETIRQAARASDAPEVLYLNDALPDEAVPQLYRACDALVHPFRGEGFGLPILEAMACGLPVIVTNSGAPLDFVNPDVAYLIDAHRETIPGDSLRAYDLAGEPFWAEPDEGQLRRLMRQAFENRKEAEELGRRAAQHARTNWTWDKAAEVAESRLMSLPLEKEHHPTFGQLAAGLALDLEIRQRAGKDLILMQKAYAEAPDDPMVISGTAKAMLNAGQWDDAVKLLEEARKHAPGRLPVLAQLCWLYAHRQREEQAYQVAVEAIAATGEDYRLIPALAALYGHYVCLGEMKGIRSAERKEAKARAEKLKAALALHGWDPASMQPLGTKLSLSMIVKDEEHHLPRCLDSVKGLVDEIVIVDTGSTDGTLQVAAKYGAKVHEFPWTDDFSEARNEALRHTTGDWVLWLDADETLEANAAKVIREAIVRPQFGGYLTQIVNFMAGEESNEVFTHRPCRLFRNVPGAKFTGRIHEQILPSLEQRGLLVANLSGARILHYGYSKSEMAAKNKLDRTIRLVSRELEDDPENSFHSFNLANALYVGGRYEEAAGAFASCADKIGANQDFCPTAYHLWAAALVNIQRPMDAIEACHKADARGVKGPGIEFSRATALYLAQRYQEGLQAVARARELPWGDETTGDHSVTGFKLTLVEGQCLLGLNEVTQAVERLEACVRESPDYTTGNYFLALAYARDNHFDKALKCLENAQRDEKLADAAALLSGELHSREGNFLQAARATGRASRRRPDDEETWARWLAFAEKAQDWSEINSAYSFRAEHGELTSDMYVNWGRACATMQDWGKALNHYQSAIEAEEPNANAFFNAGDCLYKLGAFAEAAEAFQTALRMDPENADGWLVLGNCLVQMQVYDAAKVAFLQALELRPIFPAAQNNLELAEEAIRATAA